MINGLRTLHRSLDICMVSSGFIDIRVVIMMNEAVKRRPHFHFYQGCAPEKAIRKNGYGGGCILIKEPMYFTHGSHKATMSSKEIDGLMEFLKSTHKLGVTVWAYIIDLWNSNNPNCPQVDIDQPIPPYKSDMESIKL